MTLEEFKSRLTESAQEAEHAVEAMAEMGGSSEEFARWEGRSDAFSQVLGWTEQLATLTAENERLKDAHGCVSRFAAQLEDERQALTDSLAEVESSNKALFDDLQTNERRRDELIAQLAEANAVIEREQKAWIDVARTFTANELFEVRRQLEQITAERDALTAKVSSLEAERDALRGVHDGLDKIPCINGLCHKGSSRKPVCVYCENAKLREKAALALRKETLSLKKASKLATLTAKVSSLQQRNAVLVEFSSVLHQRLHSAIPLIVEHACCDELKAALNGKE